MKPRATRFPPRCLTMLLIERNLMLKKVTRREALQEIQCIYFLIECMGASVQSEDPYVRREI